MRKPVYAVGALKESISIEMWNGRQYPVPCTWADGMVGALPVFYDYERAKAYANGYQILVFEAEVPERN